MLKLTVLLGHGIVIRAISFKNRGDTQIIFCIPIFTIILIPPVSFTYLIASLKLAHRKSPLETYALIMAAGFCPFEISHPIPTIVITWFQQLPGKQRI